MENKTHWLILTGLLWLRICSLTESKCHCETNCSSFPREKCTNCSKGWYGPYCQKRNVALNGNATQQGFYIGQSSENTGWKTVHFTAELAVDGLFHSDNTKDDNFFSKPLTCAHTDGNASAWWSVTIKSIGINQIKYMRIYNRRHETTKERRNGMEILVDGQRCYKWGYYETPPAISNVTCSRTLIGDVVKIKVHASDLSLCEVQVFVCSDFWFGEECHKQCRCRKSSEVCDKVSGQCQSGCQAGFQGDGCQEVCSDFWFGEECDKQCQCRNSREVCDKVNGQCQSGCQAGFQGDGCQQVCSDFWFGEECDKQCQCRNSIEVCDKVSGQCQSGCQAGFQGDGCQQECSNGTYGLNCVSRCGHCLGTKTCIKTDGRCPHGCETGWTNTTCHAECPNGRYGKNCSGKCEHCENNDVCNKVNGSCSGDCQAGWISDKCDKECPNGTFGQNCTGKCGHCQNNDVCNKVTGSCLGDCQAGWISENCDKECDNGTYGLKCKFECGNCNNSRTCNKIDGHCPMGCEAGWTTDRCDTELSTTSQATWTPMVIVLVIIVVVLVTIVVITLWKKRRNKKRSSDMGSPAISPPNDSPGLGPDADVTEEAVEADYTVEVYVDDTYENATSCRKYSPSAIPVDKLQQYIQNMTANKGFKTEYKMHPYGINGLVEVGRLPENKIRNRFAALYPYDHSRVELKDGGESDYINASYIPGWKVNNRYIATQGPTVATVNDLWRMVWQEKVVKIVMVTNLSEMNKKKCEQYWPSENKSKDCGDMHIKTESFVSRANFNISGLVIRHRQSGEQRRLTHFHYTAWPDHDVPAAPALVSFWKKVRQTEEGAARPLVVHCSAGVGRTGTFIALDYLMDQAQAENKISVFDCVAKQRAARMNMIQTPNQYQFIHVAVLEGLKSKLTLYTSASFEKTFGSSSAYSKQQDGLLKKEFMDLLSLKPQLTGKAISDALLPENIAKNKNRGIVPENKSRPFLSTPVIGCTNYINAVILPCFQTRAKLVATETPMQDTIVDFWRLVYDHDCFTIVCLDDETTGLYPCVGQPVHSGPFVIEQLQASKLDCFTTERKLILRNNKQSNSTTSLTLYSFNPPTSSASRDTASLLELVTKVERVVSSEDHKVLVHCPDGVGLCGVFSSVLGIVSRLRLDADIDIFLTIRELQLIRPQFIQTVDQYKFCYDMVKEYFRSSNIYTNM